MKELKLINIFIIVFTLFSCSETGKKSSATKEFESNDNIEKTDPNFTTYETTRYLTSSSKKSYSTKSLKSTLDGSDKNSSTENQRNFIIKISEKKIVILEDKKLLFELFVNRKWVEKIGPDTCYDLKDKEGIDYYFSHYSGLINGNEFILRYQFIKNGYLEK